MFDHMNADSFNGEKFRFDSEQITNTEFDAATSQNINSTFDFKLASFRAQNPFVQMTDLPNSVINLVLSAGVAKDVNLPQMCKAIRIRGNADYWLNDVGNAAVPVADVTDGSGAIFRPDGVIYFVEDLRSFSLVSGGACLVSIECFIQQ